MSDTHDATIRTAVIGFGLAGKVFHCPFVSAVPGLELSAIVQRRGDEAARAYPRARILRSPEEAFDDPEIDLIVVATPNETHFELASAALNAGKDVVVDKPITSSAKSARALADLATKHGRLLAPFHNRRWDGDFLTLRKLLAEGTLGRVVEIVSRFDRYRPVQRQNTWKEVSGPSTGLLADLGPHLIDQALALFGPPARITASLRHDRERTDIDDAFDLVLDYDLPYGRALRYGCHATMLAADPSPRFLVHGTHGSFRKGGVDPQEPTMVDTGRRPPMLGSPEPWISEPEADWGIVTVAVGLNHPAELTRSRYPTVPGDYRLFYANVRDAILGKAPLAVTAEDGYRNLRLIDLARQSSQERRTLPVTWN
jgi:predicted dehydrogenase